jgi:hypothetical protein
MTEPTLIEFTTEEGLRPVGAFRKREAITEESQRAMDKAMHTISLMAENVQEAVRNMKGDIIPADIEVEFGLKFDIELGVMIAKTSDEGGIKVKMRWYRETQRMTK